MVRVYREVPTVSEMEEKAVSYIINELVERMIKDYPSFTLSVPKNKILIHEKAFTKLMGGGWKVKKVKTRNLIDTDQECQSYIISV